LARERERSDFKGYAPSGKPNIQEEGKIFSRERQTRWSSTKGQTMRVAIYARVSTLDQHSGMQSEDLQEFCKRREFELVDSYIDEGVSGSKDSRPELNRLMADARKRRFDAVVVWKLDRFGRSLKHLVNAIAELEAVGVAFISYKESLDLSTPAGKLMFHVIAAMAQFERDLIRERTKAGVAFARSKGKRIGRPRLAVQSTEVHRLLAAGHSLRAIGRQLGVSEGSVRRLASTAA
jgi:DNA invertase Pin-like site-specific DNA recombinase